MERENIVKSFMVAVICLLASIASKPSSTMSLSGSSLIHTIKLFLIASFFTLLMWRIIVYVKNKSTKNQ